jgi:sugar phosphate isomerase/epimerase
MDMFEPQIGFTGLSRRRIAEDIKFAMKYKFEWYEIQGTETKFELSSNTIKKIKKILKRANVNLRLHVPYFLPISSSIPKVPKAVLNFAKKEILLAKKLNAKGITIHSGKLDSTFHKEIIKKQIKILIGNLKEIVRLGKKYGIEIGLENSWKDSICIKPEEILKIVRKVPGLKVVLDIGHTNAARLNPIKYLEKIRKYLSAVHIHDNKGNFDEHASIGKGNIKFKEFFKKCKELKFYGPFIMEIFPKKNVIKSKKIFLKIWNEC